MSNRYNHLIVDNLEEDTPIAHDILSQWLSEIESALLIYDHNAGFRRFLGADSITAFQLKELCEDHKKISSSFVTSPDVEALAELLTRSLPVSSKLHDEVLYPPVFLKAETGNPHLALNVKDHRYYPQMLDWVADQIFELIDQDGFSPGDIVVLAPYLSDVLRFSLINRLEVLNIPAQTHRPSRSLREEPATQCLLTLAMLAFPEWDFSPTKFDLAYALIQAIDGLDLIRAQLLVENSSQIVDGKTKISSFDVIAPAIQERITYLLGERFEYLYQWLTNYGKYQEEFDHFLSRLFGEVLSQPGYGFHEDLDAGRVAAVLVESVKKFRWAAGETLTLRDIPLGKEYISMVNDGVIAAQYMQSWHSQHKEAVLIAPAHTFLMRNYPVKIQFWLDIGSRGWFERLYQPLTQPYVLTRQWEQGRKWTDVDEVAVSQDSLQRLTMGLLRRCENRVYIGISELGENGYEHRGPLMGAFQRVLRSLTDR